MNFSNTRNRLFTAVLCCAAFSTAACSTKPVPETFASLNTFAIAQKVRCEMRDALINLRGTFPPASEAYKAKYIEPSDVLQERGKSPPKGKNFILTVIPAEDTAIAYEFTFDILENNDLTGSIDFFDLITAGAFSLNVTAENKRARNNVRNFRLVEDSKALIDNQDLGAECEKIEKGEGIFYPITGELGLEESLRTFYNLRQTNALEGPGNKKTPTLADTMEFTTTAGGSINPGINLSGPRSNISLDKTGVGIRALRTDKHKLALVFAINETSAIGKGRSDPPEASARGLEAADPQRATRLRISETIRGALLGELERQRQILLQQNGLLLVQ